MHDEYLRRNLVVCKAVDAHANASAALERLRSHKRPPQWLVKYLEGIIKRCEPLPSDLADWRDMAWDAPIEAFLRARFPQQHSTELSKK